MTNNELGTGTRSVEFLNKIYQNAEMGSKSINYISEKIENANLLSDLQEQHRQYTFISSKAQTELANQSSLPKDKNPLAQVGVWSSVQLGTVLDRSPDKIAEMMIQGSMMGVIDMTRTLKQYNDIPQNLQQLGNELISIEENSIQRMKSYIQ